MNNKIRIIVDSAADLAESIKDKVTILPMTLRFGDDEYLDGVTITKQEFYEKLIESDTLPTTSQIMPLGFEEAYREALSQGEDVVVITVSSKLSGETLNRTIRRVASPDRRNASSLRVSHPWRNIVSNNRVSFVRPVRAR